HIKTEESRAIVRELAEALGDATFAFHPGVAYRHILVVKGHNELLQARYTPPHDISDRPIAGHLPEGPGAGVLLDLMERARPVLQVSAVNRTREARGDVPASDIWPFWPGSAPQGLRPFTEVRGVRAALSSGVDLLNGLAVLFGIDRLDIEGVSDGPDNDYRAQIEGSLSALDDHDVVIVHVESPDEEGHAGNVAGKVAAIEAIDREMVSVLREHLHEVRVLAMPDHPTPIELKTHVGEPVPFVLAGPGVEPNGGREYRELTASQTGLLIDPGHGVMDLLLR
ncbi:cofactor-independent phosphoglycerate mutase, partial [bacterium]|nr:cofactor-independent phosphoglycerate mutase [bacterium]